MPPKLLIDLPADVVQHIVIRLTLAHHIARIAPTSRVISVAVRNAIKVRQFSGEVRVWLLNGTLENTFELHTSTVLALVALPDNQHALSGSRDKTVKLFNVNDGAVVRIFKHHTEAVNCLALLPDGLRFVSGSVDGTARIAEIGSL